MIEKVNITSICNKKMEFFESKGMENVSSGMMVAKDSVIEIAELKAKVEQGEALARSVMADMAGVA